MLVAGRQPLLLASSVLSVVISGFSDNGSVMTNNIFIIIIIIIIIKLHLFALTSLLYFLQKGSAIVPCVWSEDVRAMQDFVRIARTAGSSL